LKSNIFCIHLNQRLECFYCKLTTLSVRSTHIRGCYNDFNGNNRSPIGRRTTKIWLN
ncbi:hypothetical protein LINGRAHAP2_LOCUS3637, partial [Linum grandiflorum]